MFMSDPSTTPSSSSSRLEWGPAHLRDEVAPLDFEPSDRPDDN